MKLEDLVKTVETSKPDDWHLLEEKVAIFKPNVDIALAFGTAAGKPCREAWVEKFANPEAQSVAVALRFRGVTVYEWEAVLADGGGRFLLRPDRQDDGSFKLAKTKLPAAMLMFRLYHPNYAVNQFLESLKQAGVPIG